LLRGEKVFSLIWRKVPSQKEIGLYTVSSSGAAIVETNRGKAVLRNKIFLRVNQKKKPRSPPSKGNKRRRETKKFLYYPT